MSYSCCFVSSMEGKERRGRYRKNTEEKPLSALTCSCFLPFQMYRSSTGNNSLHSFTEQRTSAFLAVLPLQGKDSPCGRDKEPQHSWLTAVLMRKSRTTGGWCIFINSCQQLNLFPNAKCSGITTADQCMELWCGAALNQQPAVIFIVLIIAIINNTLRSPILILKTQIAINVLNSRQQLLISFCSAAFS